MWIFCGGMKRSGSTLQYQIASQLVEQAGTGMRMKWCASSEFPAVRDQHSELHCAKVFKAHDCTPEIMREISEGGALSFYIYRDLRDVIASQMQMSRVTFDQLWSAGFLHECVDNSSRWTSLPGVLTMRYEDVIQDLARLVYQMAQHISITKSLQECRELAADFDIASQRRRIEEARERARFERVAAIGHDLFFDPHSLLHANHIRSGQWGAWRELLSVEEVARLEATFGAWLARHHYPAAAQSEASSLRQL